MTALPDAEAAARAAARRSARLGAEVPRGAALVAVSGEVYAAPELPDPGDGTGGCAERTAVILAVTAGERRFQRLVLRGGRNGGADPGPPCGACLQILLEFSPDLRVHWSSAGAGAEGRTVRELLPGAFAAAQLPAARRPAGARARRPARPA